MGLPAQGASKIRILPLAFAPLRFAKLKIKNWFLPLAIKVFGCFQQQSDNFFHQCAIMV